jgi:hypothetical protein
MFDRLVDHLKAHEIDVDDQTLTLGEWLDIDSEKEHVTNHEAANAIVEGFYRAPYRLPSV